jgi:hypothetical protein
MDVLIKPSVYKSLQQIGDYIFQEFELPETAFNFVNNLITFGNAIANHPEAYPICKYPIWANQNMRCAIDKKKIGFCI